MWQPTAPLTLRAKQRTRQHDTKLATPTTHPPPGASNTRSRPLPRQKPQQPSRDPMSGGRAVLQTTRGLACRQPWGPCSAITQLGQCNPTKCTSTTTPACVITPPITYGGSLWAKTGVTQVTSCMGQHATGEPSLGGLWLTAWRHHRYTQVNHSHDTACARPSACSTTSAATLQCCTHHLSPAYMCCAYAAASTNTPRTHTTHPTHTRPPPGDPAVTPVASPSGGARDLHCFGPQSSM